MSRSILRKQKRSQQKMEIDSNSSEPFLQIGSIWSESQNKCDKITMEEDISMCEPEVLVNELPGNTCDILSNENHTTERPKHDTISKGILESLKKNNDMNEKNNTKECSYIKNKICVHEPKKYKIIKKRLYCNECKSFLCPECYCTLEYTPQNHFSKSDNNNKSLYPCKLCSMVFRSNCSLQAHRRVHLLDTPYVCPDCGVMYNNVYFLSLHLINKCFHVYKVITNGCKTCLSQKMTRADFLSHIEKAHIKEVYKCSYCGLLFECTRDMNRHLATSHINLKASAVSYFCCSMCGNLIISKHLYTKHVNYHMDRSAAFQIGYLCPCGGLFNTANNFRIHFRKCNKKGVLPPQWTYLNVTLKSQEMLVPENSLQKRSILQSQSGFPCNSVEFSRGASTEEGGTDYAAFDQGSSSEEYDEHFDDFPKSNSDDDEYFSAEKVSKITNEKAVEVSAENPSEITTEKSSENTNEDTVKTTTDESDKNKSYFTESGNKKIMTIDLSHSENDVEFNGGSENPTENYHITDKVTSSSVKDSQTISEENIHNETCGTSQGASDVYKAVSLIDDADLITEKSGLIPNVQLVEEFSHESLEDGIFEEGSIRLINSDKVEKSVDKSLKIIYDHIPCDHLGYLKTQQGVDVGDANLKRDHKTNINKTGEFGESHLISNAEMYVATESVLDEKTGMMRTKKVHIQKSKAESEGCDLGADEADCTEIFPNVLCREIAKTRSSTFFSCPFCTVLFPKHYSSFQRFRLHLECYHPDASLDITVDRTQIPKSQTPFTSITVDDDLDSDNDAYDLDDVDLQTRLNESLRGNERKHLNNANSCSEDITQNKTSQLKKKKDSCTAEDERQRSRSESYEPEMKLKRMNILQNKHSEKMQNSSERRIQKIEGNLKKSVLNRKEKNSLTSSMNQNHKFRSLIPKNFLNCNSKPSLKNSSMKVEENCEDYTQKITSFRNVVDQNEESSEAIDSENSRGAKSNQSTGDENEFLLTDANITKYRKNTVLKKPFNLMNHKNRRGNRNSLSEDQTFCEDVSNDSQEAKDHGMQLSSGPDGLNSKLCRVRSLCGKEHYFKRFSKSHTEELSSSDCTDMNFQRSDNIKLSKKDEEESEDRCSERRNSRRESDVWSEFYKTLKIAETLKKTNVKNRDRDKEESKDTSILTNYANKRIVKKPKRYRESSDSDESNDEGKHSAGDPKIFKVFDSRTPAYGNEQDDEESFMKKKRLLRRLENVDDRIVDFLCDIIDNKEKAYGLLSKNSDSGVRSCRKKSCNGIKIPVRQSKTIAIGQNEDEMNRDYFDSTVHKEVVDFNCDDVDWYVPNILDEKTSDRKRGRPRKSDSAMVVRERRRSDFDRGISFIEKNFEAETDADFLTNKRRRKLSSKLQFYKKTSSIADKNDFSSGQVITSKSLESEKKLTCAVCKECYQSELEFREHIQSHRVDENNHQCMECGECFVVRPSLEKHLHAFHKIKDVQKYIEDNDCTQVEKNDEIECEPLKENQCKVCRDQFSNAHDLNKHFRIHGMAFLREFKKDK